MAPAVIALEQKYQKKGVVFLGLTMEGEGTLADSRRFLEATGITWPNGYGASETLQALKSETIPRLWVINRKNDVVWDESSSDSVEEIIDQALADAP